MDSTNESFTISIKETLLQKNQQLSPPKHTRNPNPEIIFFSVLILVIFVSNTMILSSICKKKKPKPFDGCPSGSSPYYCHLTMYPELCNDSMSSIVTSPCDLKFNPGLIFSGSLRVATNGLNNITISITQALSSTASNSIVEPRLSKCLTWVHDSLSRLNESLCKLGVDSDVVSLTYEEVDNMKALTMAATADAFKCFSTLQEVDHLMDEEGEEKMRVDEVKWGLEKERKYMVNSIGLLNKREYILFDFYNPFIDQSDSNYYDHVCYYYFDYRFLVFLYSVLYLFLGLLYFLFLSGD